MKKAGNRKKEQITFLVTFVVILFAIGLVIAYGLDNPLLHGHNASEVANLQAGSAGDIVCFMYYCTASGDNPCTDSGDPNQGYCPAGSTQEYAAGDWGHTHEQLDNGPYYYWSREKSIPYGCNPQYVDGQAYLCCKVLS